MALRVSHLLVDTISYQTRATVDSYGDPTYATIATCKARVEYGVIDARVAGGEQSSKGPTIYTETLVPVGSKVWLPGESTGDVEAACEVQDIEYYSAPTGGTLYVLRF